MDVMATELQISPVIRSKAEAKSSYDRLSGWYDLLAGWGEKKARDTGLRELKAKLGESILEVGSGTGHCIETLAKSIGDSGEVYGIDVSKGMLKITRGRIRKAQLSKRVELICGDATILPFKADLFDAIFMSFILELFETSEISAVLSECRRVLQRDGRICVVAMSKKETFTIGLYEWMHRRFPKQVDCRPIFVQEVLKDSGFNIISVTELSMWRLPVEVVVAKKT